MEAGFGETKRWDALKATASVWKSEAALAALYFASGVLLIFISRQPGALAQLWFGNALALAFMLRVPDRIYTLLAAALLGGMAANLIMATPLPAASGLMAGNMIEICVAYAVVRLWHRGPVRIESDVWTFLRILAGAAVIGPLCGGMVGALSVNMAFGAPFGSSYLTWVEGAAVGAIGILPLAMLLNRASIQAMIRWTTPRQVTVLVPLTAVSAVVAHVLPEHPQFLIGVPVLLAALWCHPLMVAMTAIGALLASVLVEAVANDAGRLGSLMYVAAIALVAPFCVTLVLQRLRDERSHQQQSALSSAVGMAEVGLDGQWRHANPALCSFLGYRAAEVPSIRWEDILEAAALRTFLVERRKLLAGMTPAIRMVARFERKDRTPVWGDIVGSVVRDQLTNEPAYIFVQVVDVTRRRAAEKALVDSEKRLVFALETGGLAVRDYDVERGMAYYSAAWNAVFGFGDGKPVNERSDAWLELVHPDDMEEVLSLKDGMKSGRSAGYDAVFRMRHHRGAWLWVHNTAKVMDWGADGRPKRIVGLYRDITAEHEARKSLEELEKRWVFALDSARQGVWDARLDEGRTYYSETWKAIIGYGPDEISDSIDAWKEFIHPDDREQVIEADTNAVETSGEGYFEFEFRMRHKDGRWIWVLDRGKVVERDEDGVPTRMIGTHTDITERREAEERLRKLSQRIHLATSAGGIGLWEFNAVTKETWWDERMRTLYGLPKVGEVPPDMRIHARHPEDRDRVERDVEDALAGIRPYDTEFRIVLSDGTVRYIRSIAEPVRDKHGEITMLRGSSYDVTEMRLLTAELAEEKERLRVTLESIGDGVITTDTDARITFMNKVAELETGWLEVEAIGKPLEDVFRLIDEWTEHAAPSPVQACLATGRPAETQDEVILLDRDRSRKDVRNTAAPILDSGGDVIGAVLVFQDVSRARRLQRQLSYSATHDGLTGLRNRAAFERDLKSFVDETIDSHEVHSLCFVDLDRFKTVNDTAGHAAGDDLLKTISRVIRQQVRSVDVAARIGGDEFALLLRGCRPEDAVGICEKTRSAIEGSEFLFEGRAFHVGASFGIARIDGTMSPSDVLSAADTACYEAKAAGRNSIHIYDLPVEETARAG